MMLDSSRVSEPRIGVVIPVFAHSELLIETIESVLDQDIDVAYRVVVVDDGCHFVSTKLAGLAALARAFWPLAAISPSRSPTADSAPAAAAAAAATASDNYLTL